MTRQPQALAPAGAWLILAAAIAAAYGWTLDSYFAGDDFGLVGRFITFPWAAWPGLFFRDWSAGLWEAQGNELRPFAALTFMIDGRVWGANPAGYHLTNVLLHFACAGVVMAIARHVLGDRWVALAAALLFALHPAQSKAVVWVSGRVDLLSAFGFLLGFYGFLRYRQEQAGRWLAVAWCAFGFGVFSKESCLLLPVVAIAIDLFVNRGSRMRGGSAAPYAGWVALMAVYALCRSFEVSAIVGVNPGAVELPSAATQVSERVVAYGGAMFLAPHLLASMKAAVLPYAGVLAIAMIALGGVMLWAAWGTLRLRAFDAVVSYGVIWTVITIAPLVLTYLSVRHLYTATAGFAIGLMALLAALPSRRQLAAAATVVIAAAAIQLATQVPLQHAALDLSRQVSDVVAQASHRAAPGDILLIDVPVKSYGTWVWGWSSPFALRPPFVPRDLTRERVVIERPGVFRQPHAWPRRGTAKRLRESTGDAWLISTVNGDVTLRKLSDDQKHVLREEGLESAESFDELIDQITAMKE